MSQLLQIGARHIMPGNIKVQDHDVMYVKNLKKKKKKNIYI